jgi:hypothetical protein
MARPLIRVLLLLACSGAAGGCATLAKKPPTPADDITPRQAAAIAAPAGERYFLLVFGSESTPKRPKYTHTWASVAKVTGCGLQDTPAVAEDTISWMPASLVIRPLSFRVEPGANLALHFTIEEMLRNEEHVSAWGPYEVSPGFAYRFGVQKAFLESGRIGYQCIDSIGEAARCGNGCDCIHAITDMDPEFDRNEYPLSRFGEAASHHIVRQIHSRPIIICPQVDHGWLLPLMGLDKYPICRKDYTGRTVPNTPENLERYLRRHEKECGRD